MHEAIGDRYCRFSLFFFLFFSKQVQCLNGGIRATDGIISVIQIPCNHGR